MLTTDARAEVYERHRPELVAYATRLVVRPDIGEELVQEAALRLLREDPQLPDDDARLRAWLFKVVSNLAIDHLRRHSTWRELVLVEARDRAEADTLFVEEARSMRGSPEHKAIAREHLIVCHQCVELDGFFNGGTSNPLSATAGALDDRLSILRREGTTPLGPWHRRMLKLVDEILEG